MERGFSREGDILSNGTGLCTLPEAFQMQTRRTTRVFTALPELFQIQTRRVSTLPVSFQELYCRSVFTGIVILIGH